MLPPAHPTPPPAPASNDTGVVPRWHLAVATATAFVAGRWGIGTAVAAVALAGFGALLAYGALAELRRRDRTAAALDSIDQRATVARLLEGNR